MLDAKPGNVTLVSTADSFKMMLRRDKTKEGCELTGKTSMMKLLASDLLKPPLSQPPSSTRLKLNVAAPETNGAKPNISLA